jgi:hypothetical protein
VERKRILKNRQRRIAQRLRDRVWSPRDEPMLTARTIHYELSDKTRGLSCGGMGAIHLMAQQLGLVEAIDARLHLLKVHLPYHESDHVLNIAYNLLAGGTCLEDLELRRQDEVYLNALGAQRIPDPTTAGDFCRRFEEADLQALMNAVNAVRVKVWGRQPEPFFDEAIIEADGHLIKTTGECKEGMDISYKGEWGYHPLLVSLANTAEPLFLMNRPGNRPSHEGAAWYLDRAARLCREAGFKRILLRGDTDFTQTAHLDRWDAAGHRFVFGIDAMPNLVGIAEGLRESAWKPLERPPRDAVKTRPRGRPENVKERIVRQRGFTNMRLQSEEVAAFDYRPTLCEKTYRVVVVRKNLSVEKGEQVLFDDVRYFFYLTNDRTLSAAQVVYCANDRCDQENLIAQLSGGVRALNAPVDNLTSNGAYMVMASLAWTLKAWFALLLPEPGAACGGVAPQALGRWSESYRRQKHCVLRMEYKTFLNAFIRVPCQIVRAGRRIIYRLLSWNPWQHVFLRGVDALRCPT